MEMIYLQRVTQDIPWGFRLYGGSDYAQPLSVFKVNAGSIASGNLQAGDVILTIANQDTKEMSHAQALQEIKNAGNTLQLGISRNKQQHQDQLINDVTSPSSYLPEPISLDTFSQKLNLNSNNNNQNNNIGSSNDSNNNFNNNDDNTTSSTTDAYNNFNATTPSWSQQQQQPYQPPPPPPPQSFQPYQPPQSQPLSPQQQKIPDALLSLAVKGDSKKPFSYVADISDIQAQREKVKRKGVPNQAIPRYQNLLSMPKFDDPPKHRGPPLTFNPQISSGSPNEKGDAVVANLQFNSPMNLYSSDNVIESLKGQTGAEIKDVVGLPQKSHSDVTQSPVYKMIHGIDQPKPKPAIQYAEAKEQESGDRVQSFKPSKYTGNAIPSRSFRMLQSMTSGENKLPSAALKQSLTDTEDDSDRHFPRQPTGNFHFRDLNEPAQQQQQQQQPHQQQQAQDYPTYYNNLPRNTNTYTPNYNSPNYANPNYGTTYSNVPPLYGNVRRGSLERREGSSEVDTSSIYQHIKGRGPEEMNPKKVRYVGKSIPSKSFKFLQNMTGGPQDGDALPSKRRQPPATDSDVEHYTGEARHFKPPQHYTDSNRGKPINASHQQPVEEPESTDF